MAFGKCLGNNIEMSIESREYLLEQLLKLKDDFEDFPDDALVRHRYYMERRIDRCLNALQEGVKNSKVIQLNYKEA